MKKKTIIIGTSAGAVLAAAAALALIVLLSKNEKPQTMTAENSDTIEITTVRTEPSTLTTETTMTTTVTAAGSTAASSEKATASTASVKTTANTTSVEPEPNYYEETEFQYYEQLIDVTAPPMPIILTEPPEEIITEAPDTVIESETTRATPQTADSLPEESDITTSTSASQAAEEIQTQPPAVITSVKYKGKTFNTSATVINLSGVKLKKTDLPELKELANKFSNLEKINLSNCGLSNETLAAFQNELNGIRVVWRIKLGTQWYLQTDAVAFSVLIMNYKHTRMTSKDLEVLKYCPDLLALDLGHQALTDLSRIADYLPDLRLLIIADNRVTDLSPLARLKHLHYLEIFVNKVKDLSPLGELRELVDVNISYNPISNIKPLLNSPMMQRLWLEHTNVSQSSVNLLRTTYPNAKIVNIGKGSVDQGWRQNHVRYRQMMDMWYKNYYGSEFQKFDDLAVELGLRD